MTQSSVGREVCKHFFRIKDSPHPSHGLSLTSLQRGWGHVLKSGCPKFEGTIGIHEDVRVKGRWGISTHLSPQVPVLILAMSLPPAHLQHDMPCALH